jgi:hypothetical protein
MEATYTSETILFTLSPRNIQRTGLISRIYHRNTAKEYLTPICLHLSIVLVIPKYVIFYFESDIEELKHVCC